MRLPPLTFSAAEAAGLVMAVLEGHRAAADPADLVGGALAKIIRVLPARVSELVRPIRDVTATTRTSGASAGDVLAAARVSPELTTALFEACAAGRRLRLSYRLASHADANGNAEGRSVEREMDVDPWAVILRHSRWYLLCWSHTRDARRVLRVDRIASAAPLPDTFTPPPGLDPLRVLEEHLSQGWKFPVDVLIDAPPADVAWWLPRSLGALSPAGDGQTRLLASTEDPEWYAGRLAALPYGFQVTESAPLRDALAELGRRLLAAGARHLKSENHELSERLRLAPPRRITPHSRRRASVPPGSPVSSYYRGDGRTERMDPGSMEGQPEQDGTPGRQAGGPDRRTYISGGRGVYAGDGGIQVNLFTGEQPCGPVVAGKVPLEPPALQPRADLARRLRAAGPGVPVVRAVTGMRGVGKTQLAAAYARACIADGWRLVAWVDAEDETAMLNGLAVVAARLGIDKPGTDLAGTGAEVRDLLTADGERCLLVFDNVTDPDVLLPYLPAAGKAQAVVTSTATAIAQLGMPVPMLVFTEDEALAFLAERVGRDDPEGARNLADELGFLPLALAQAAAVIRRRELSYAEYLSLLHASPVSGQLLRGKAEQYPRGTAEAILLSVGTLTADDRAGLSGTLLGMISLLSPDGVQRQMLRLAAGTDIFSLRPASVWGRIGRLGGRYPRRPVDEAAVDEAIGRLAESSLVSISGGPSPAVTAHLLVRRVIRERAAGGGALRDLAAKSIILLLTYLQSVSDPMVDRHVARDFVRQVTALEENLATRPAGRAETLMRLGLRFWALAYLNDLGDSPPRAVELGESLAASFPRYYGGASENTLTVRNNLALAYQAAGRPGEAIPLFERTLAASVKYLKRDHSNTLRTRGNLALAYQAAGRLAEALPLHEGVVAAFERQLGDDHPGSLPWRNNLANAYEAAGRLDEALPLYEQVLMASERHLGHDHPKTLKSRNNLAAAYRAAGRFDEAIALHKRVLEASERDLGQDHPDTLTSRNNLATAYRETGRAEEAIALHRQVLAGREQQLGHDHPATVTARNNLALAYQDCGQLDEAIPLFEEGQAGLERALGAEHPATAAIRKNLADARRRAANPGGG
jgi:tetratricopeptide (TPR) repeat protein/predicted DNA-binding transcriptional regulator YafY